MRFWVFALVLGGCGFPRPSEALACQVDLDCKGGRTCEGGFCVGGDEVGTDASVSEDAATDGTLPPDADPFEAIAAACTTAGYTPLAGTTSLVRDVPTGASWTAADADCTNDVVGATHLIVLSSEVEAAFMKTKRGWVGLFDSGTNVFASVTGEPADLRPFASGQPDNGNGNENCVQYKDNNGLDDDQCGNSHRYVCECDGLPRAP